MKTSIVLLSILVFCSNCSKNRKYAEHLPICNICPDTFTIYDSVQNTGKDSIVEDICHTFDFCFTNSNKDTIAFGFRLYLEGTVIIDIINDNEDIVEEFYNGKLAAGAYIIRWPVKGNDEYYGIRIKREDRTDTKWFYLD